MGIAREGILWQGLDATQAIEAYRRRFGRLPAEFWAHKGDEVTGVAVIVTYVKDIPAGHLWMPVAQEHPGEQVKTEVPAGPY